MQESRIWQRGQKKNLRQQQKIQWKKQIALAAAIEASKTEAQNAEATTNEASTSATNEADKPAENPQ